MQIFSLSALASIALASLVVHGAPVPDDRVNITPVSPLHGTGTPISSDEAAQIVGSSSTMLGYRRDLVNRVAAAAGADKATPQGKLLYEDIEMAVGPTVKWVSAHDAMIVNISSLSCKASKDDINKAVLGGQYNWLEMRQVIVEKITAVTDAGDDSDDGYEEEVLSAIGSQDDWAKGRQVIVDKTEKALKEKCAKETST